MDLLKPFPRSALLLLSLGLAVHCASAVLVMVFNPGFVSPESDQYGYRVLALNLLDHQSFSMLPPPEGDPMLLRTPGYPAFLAGIYALDRSNLLLIIVQQLMLVAAAAMTYFLMRRFDVGLFVAFGIFFLILFEPMQWLYSLQTMTEALALFLCCSALVLALLWNRPAMWRVFLIGLILGLMALVKPNLLLFIPAIALLFAFSQDASSGRKLVLCLLVIATALTITAPWVLRNYALTGVPIFSSSSAVNFIVGLGSTEESTLLSAGVPIDGRCCRLPYWDAPAYPALADMQHAIIEREGLPRLVFTQLAYAPRVFFDQQFFIVLAQKVGIPAAFAGKTIAVAQGILLTLLATGLFFMARKGNLLQTCVFLFMLAVVLVLNARVSYSRMLIPLYPLFAILAGIAMTEFMSFFRKKGKPSLNTPMTSA